MKTKSLKVRVSLILVICLMMLSLSACGKGDGDGGEGSVTTTPTATEKDDKTGEKDTDDKNPGKNEGFPPKTTVAPTPELVKSESISNLAKEQNKKEEKNAHLIELQLDFYSDGSFEFAQDNQFYDDDVKLTIKAPSGAKVYYTLDGSEPNLGSYIYTEPLDFLTLGGDFPDAYTLRACMINDDGTMSNVAARTFLVGRGTDSRFSSLVFFISGDPAELTDAPYGILYGDNAFERGRESERKVYIEAFEADGTPIFAQYGGVRIYGGYSRNSSIKSFKIFSRKSYDEEHKNFKIDAFQTPKLGEGEEGEVIKKYDKLVLRNGGNDNQFAFIRDELSQTLVKKAGFETYEAVLPAVVYLNGHYYAFHWLHENYCDKYFKERFGDGEGEFVILEGGDQIKDDDEEIQDIVNEYNDTYDKFVASDLKNDAVYNQLCEFLDIESYLDFFAWNIALNNWDWPNNNYKCYKYVPASGESLGEGVFDGKWRFLPHDMDYTYGIYDQAKAKENYNTLRVVMDENNERYSPLFTKLMERKDCREYFRNKTMEFLNGALSEESIKEEYEKLHASRRRELLKYYDFLDILNRRGDWTIWTRVENYANNEKQIYTFAEKRGAYVIRYMDELLPELE
ncbi:MAG: CotH kinase family protein [Lachnospiraceae bacterium]|nr:CotH kinase family protein [Lachnospiraceae bacterium]